VTDGEQPTAIEESPMNRPLAVLLAMAMFVLVVDTSIMNVSISSVVRDLDTTVSGVQSAIALEVALLVPIIAGLLGLLNSFRMSRLPDVTPSSAAEGMSRG
jgi:hypothetical protein